jgi:hypothetical protein
LVQALGFGFFMQLLRIRSEGTRGQEGEPSASIHIGLGVILLGLFVWHWRQVPPFPKGGELFAMLGSIAFAIWLLGYGLILARRNYLRSSGS